MADRSRSSIIDDYSRAVLCSSVVSVATAADVVRLFYETAAQYGLPAPLLSDNGAIYTAAYAALGISFKHGKPYPPAVSTSERKELGKLLRWFHVSERGAGTVVQAGREATEVLSAQC